MESNQAPGSHDQATSGWTAAKLEILIAALVTGVVILAVVWAARSQARLRQSDAELELAYVACQSQLEALRRVPFAQLGAMDGSGFDVLGLDGSPGGLRALPGDEDGLPGRFTVAVDKTTDDAVLYRVTAAVEWQGTLRNQTFELETLMGARR